MELTEIKELIDSNHRVIMGELSTGRQMFKELTEDLRGNPERNIEGVIPGHKRHEQEINAIKEQIPKAKEGMWKWIEEHPNTIKIGLIIYAVLFHGALLAKLLKFI